MTRTKSLWLAAAAGLAVFLAVSASRIGAKEKPQPLDPNDPTLRLFQLLDGSYGGKLADYYLLADVYSDPKTPGQDLQHVLRIEYNKSRAFAKLSVYVRSVGKMQPEQLKAYSPKMVYEFGEEDSEKFMKTDPGPFSKTSDVYLRSTPDHPLAGAPVTDDVRKSYERLLTEFVLPSLQKK